MAAVPDPIHSVAVKVYDHWRQLGEAEPERTYLGASIIGGPCERALWFGFRWAERRTFDGRTYRLFERGRNEEKVIIDELRGIGCEVSDSMPNGEQWGFKDIGGHFSGHMDAAARGTPYAPKSWCVCEFKTHSAKSFKELVDKGVVVAKPEHWHQMNIYMGKFGIDRAMYYAVCKDDDRIHTEWLHFDKDEYERMMDRARRIINSAEPPERISNDASWYQCKFCDYRSICHSQSVPRAHCRTCAHATPETGNDTSDKARWSCTHLNSDISLDMQRVGCNGHRFIPILLDKFAEYLGTPDGVNPQYRNRLTGNIFHNGSEIAEGAHPHYNSIEIRAAHDKRALGDAGVEEFRQVFGARIGEAA